MEDRDFKTLTHLWAEMPKSQKFVHVGLTFSTLYITMSAYLKLKTAAPLICGNPYLVLLLYLMAEIIIQNTFFVLQKGCQIWTRVNLKMQNKNMYIIVF